jgi:hypothetical protein
LEEFRDLLDIPYVRECGPGDALAELLRDFVSAGAVKISDDDVFHFARAAKVINDRATHQTGT